MVTLLLFAGNLLVPAGAAAMSLHCDMDMAAHSAHDCCEDSEMDHHNKSDVTENTDDCMQLSFCEQVISSKQSDIPAIVQLGKSVVIAANFSHQTEWLSDETDTPNFAAEQSTDNYESPPLFLMNSVFLN